MNYQKLKDVLIDNPELREFKPRHLTLCALVVAMECDLMTNHRGYGIQELPPMIGQLASVSNEVFYTLREYTSIGMDDKSTFFSAVSQFARWRTVIADGDITKFGVGMFLDAKVESATGIINLVAPNILAHINDLRPVDRYLGGAIAELVKSAVAENKEKSTVEDDVTEGVE